MANENYNYQIQDIEKEWDDIQAKTVAFPSRKEAVTFAYNLSYMLDGTEIRFTQGDPKKESGTFIRM